MTTFNLSVVAPDRTVAEVDAIGLEVPAHDGYMGVWSHHEPMIVALRPGVLAYRDERDNKHHIAISGGFLEVSGTGAIVLADDAKLAHEIDVREEEMALEQARKALRGEESTVNPEEATYELEEALVRIRTARTTR
ncbi:MAG: ATP synthase F1 subunit epsilon [Armatimonadetes bacterium]|nr:ATP synthase F1 subunit epsilon [Armatimonadota bacterium]